MTMRERLRLCDAMRDGLHALQPNYMITLTFGYLIKPVNARPLMTRFFNVIQREAFGRKWASQRDRDWPVAHDFFEHPHSNPHFHVLARVDQILGERLENGVAQLWTDITRRGQLHVQRIKNLEAEVIYCTKDLYRPGYYEETFLYADTRQ